MADNSTEKTDKHARKRAELLKQYEASNAGGNAFWDELISLALGMGGGSKATVSFVDEDYQWIKARRGFDVDRIPLRNSIDQWVLDNTQNSLVIEDLDDSDHPAAQMTASSALSGIRFYAGAALKTGEDVPIGSIAIMDTVPQQFSEDKRQHLERLARIAMEHVEKCVQLTTTEQQSIHENTLENVTRERDVLRNLVDNLPDFEYVINREGKYVLDNAAHRRLLGVSSLDEVVGKTVYDFFSEEVARWNSQSDAAVLETGEPLLNSEESFYDPEGQLWEVASSRVPLHDEHGHVQGVACIGRDISHRKRAEETLEKERYLLETLMQNITDHIYFKDLQGSFIQISNALAKRFGLPSTEAAVGKTDFDFFTEEHAWQAYEDEQAIIRSGEAIVNKEEKETWPSGAVSWVSTTKEPLRDRNAQIIGTFGISRDITEFKQVRDQLAEYNRQNREEMQLAKRIHQALLPVEAPDYAGLEFGLRFVPSGDIGGDFIDFIDDKQEGRFGVVFADITGHGTGAALLSAMLKVLVDEITDREDSVKECFNYLNHRLYHEYPAGLFASGVYAVFDTTRKTMTYVNASQEPIILLRQGEQPAVLGESDGALGVLDPEQPQAPQFKEHIIHLQEGDTIFFYTDGLVDFFNDMEETAEQRERLIGWLAEHQESPPQDLVDDIYQRSLLHANLSEPQDDMAALAVRIAQ